MNGVSVLVLVSCDVHHICVGVVGEYGWCVCMGVWMMCLCGCMDGVDMWVYGLGWYMLSMWTVVCTCERCKFVGLCLCIQWMVWAYRNMWWYVYVCVVGGGCFVCVGNMGGVGTLVCVCIWVWISVLLVVRVWMCGCICGMGM